MGPALWERAETFMWPPHNWMGWNPVGLFLLHESIKFLKRGYFINESCCRNRRCGGSSSLGLIGVQVDVL